MNKNIEIKARISDFLLVEKKAASLAGQQPDLILQEDIFFNVPKGRLKAAQVYSRAGRVNLLRTRKQPSAEGISLPMQQNRKSQHAP